MTAQLDSFETALLARLRARVEGDAPATPPRWSPRWSRRRVVLAGAATVAAAAVMVVVVPGIGTTPAYSVTQGNSGAITVEVRRLEDAPALEAELAELGLAADITYVPGSQECAPGRYTPVGRSLTGLTVSMGTELLRVTFPPGTVRDDETFVMAISGAAIAPSSEPSEEGLTDLEGFSSWTEFDVTAGPVQACTPVPGSD